MSGIEKVPAVNYDVVQAGIVQTSKLQVGTQSDPSYYITSITLNEDGDLVIEDSKGNTFTVSPSS